MIKILINKISFFSRNSLNSESTYDDVSKRKNDLIPFSAGIQVIKQSESTIRSAYIEVSFPSKIIKGNKVYGFTFQPKIEVNSELMIKNNFSNFSI